MKCRFTIDRSWALTVLLCLPSATGFADPIDLTELFDEVDSALTNLDATTAAELREAVRDFRTEMQGEYVVQWTPLSAEELHFVIPSPTLELPEKPPVTTRPLWPAPSPSDWPVGAEVYVRQLKRVFIEQGVPAELIWLAEVESGFEPWARSRAGAAGLFQLMPETAELLGLSLKPHDERFLPVKSARAAARYLNYLYEKFRDWRLTLAAYNAGEGRVRRLLDQSRARRYEEIAGLLPVETRLYVPKVEDTILRREGVALRDLKSPSRRP